MSTRPGVAVVVPVWNSERFLAPALESIRAQTLPAEEVVVVDDGSTDESAAVAEAVARDWPAVRVIRQANGGPSAARNAGVAATSGSLITFLDADDRMPADRLEIQAARLSESPPVDLVFGHDRIEVEPGVPLPLWYEALAPGVPNPIMMTMMFPRRVWDLVGPFDEALRHGEDTDWFSRALTHGVSVALMPQVALLRRLHGANMTQDVPLAEMQAALTAIIRARIHERRARE